MAPSLVSPHGQGTGTGPVVRAAGGVVVRLSDRWELQVALVHRPVRADWSLPKGKVDPGETLEACALREVREETGFHCRLGRFLETLAYVDRRDRPKTVAYWLMEPLTGAFEPSEEVDELRWEPIEGALGLLSYDRDRELVAWVGRTLLARSG